MEASAKVSTRCPHCFSELGAGQGCSRCGQHGQPRASPLVLPVGTLLARQYRIGQVLGNPGGFGITYLAWDERLETRVAIKEYFPREFASRVTGQPTLQPHTERDHSLFDYGLQEFLAEARRLARFDHANIVRVKNFFEENGTGYLVMDYYEGQSLAAYLARQPEGRLQEQLAVRIMQPVLDGLRVVHATGMLHRDIDPNNIYVTTQGKIILLDFGAARMAVGDKSRSLSVILKPGYAPYEQYASNGRQGPWTDVYACAATLYRLVTGVIPPDAPGRIMDDTLRPAHELNPQVSGRLSEVLQRALALRPEERPQTVEEFQRLLMGEQTTAPPPRPPGPGPTPQPDPRRQPPVPTGARPVWQSRAAVAVGAAVVLLAGAVIFGSGEPTSGPGGISADTLALIPGPVPAPIPAPEPPWLDEPATPPDQTEPVRPVPDPVPARPVDPPPPRGLTIGGSQSNFGSRNLAAGFTPDPFTHAVVAGGSIDVSSLALGGDCIGHVSRTPDFIVHWTGSSNLLRFFFEGDDDATLIINDPQGNWRCNDDAFDTWHPALDFRNPRAGQYDVWVGTYDRGTSISGTLSITELDSRRPRD